MALSVALHVLLSAFLLTKATAGTGVSQTTTPFGTLFVFQDPMTVTANRSSKQRRGSISIVGGTHNIKPADHPVVGGTGDFKLVQGYVTSSPVNLTGLTVTYKIAFHLYWPPYATQAS
ncbi:hypothetical protein M0R45_003841 [Rubus argutus]|uniref:Dirigent protein n=1 Tax=Rubus argutus TaxID=59490 RepID=A0AAW1YGC5_RUBAR